MSHLADGTWKVGVEQLAAALVSAHGSDDEILAVINREVAAALLAVRGVGCGGNGAKVRAQSRFTEDYHA